MIFNEALYTPLTWSQLLIGLIIGLISAFLIRAMERRQKPQHERARVNTNSAKKRADLPQIVLGIIRAAYYTLGVLAVSRKPIFLGSLVCRVHAAQLERRDKELLTPVAIRMAVDRLVSYGNVRLEKRGLSITESGMELLTRVARISEQRAPEPRPYGPIRVDANDDLAGGTYTGSAAAGHSHLGTSLATSLRH